MNFVISTLISMLQEEWDMIEEVFYSFMAEEDDEDEEAEEEN